MTAAEARERFAAGRVAPLATADRTGRPQLVPIAYAIEDDRVYNAVHYDAEVHDHAPAACKRARALAVGSVLAVDVERWSRWSAH